MAKNQWGDEVVAAPASGSDWGDKPAAQKDLPADVKPSTAGSGRGSVNPPLALSQARTPERVAPTEVSPPVDTAPSDPMGSGFSEIMAQPAKRSSVLEGMQLPEPTFDPAVGLALSNRQVAEQTPIPGQPRRAEQRLEPRTASEATSAATTRGEALQDASLPVRATFKAVAGAAQGAGGLMRAAGDLTGIDSLSRAGTETAKGANQFETGMGETGAVEGFGPKSPVPYISNMAEGAASSLAQSAAYAGGLGAKAVIPLMSLMTAGQEYDKARTQGLDPAMALAGAIPKGVFEAIGEKFTGLDKVAGAMGTLLTKGASAEAKRGAADVLVKSGIKEIPGEVVTYLGQTATDLLPGIGLNPDLTMSQFVDGLRDTVVQAGIMGGTMGVAGAAVRSKTQQPADQLQRTDTRRPVEIRKAIDNTADDFAAEHGIPSKAVQAARAKAETMPMAQVPGFYRKFFAALASKTGRQIDDSKFSAFDSHTESLTPKPVTPASDTPAATMADIAALEASQNTDSAQSIPASAAPESIAEKDAFDAGNDVAVTPETDAVHAAATSPLNDLPEPTKAQKDAGNYKVGRMRVAGLDIAIENPQGSTRRGVDADGKPWESPMRHHYGYFNGTLAADGDKLDVFVQPGTPEDYKGPVYVVDQIDPKTGKLDEHKVLIGPNTEEEARAMYQSNYDAGWQGLGAITRLPLPAFKAWAKSGALEEPLGDIQTPQVTPAQATANPAPAADSAAAQVPASASGAPVNAGTTEQPNAPLNTPSNQPPDQQIRARTATENIAPENQQDQVAQRAAAAKAEDARKAKAARLRGYTYDKSPFLAFLGKHGIALSQRADFTPDKNPMLSGYGPMFRRTGKNTDVLLQNAIEENFLPEGADQSALDDLIAQQISGMGVGQTKRIEAIYSPDVADRVMTERMADTQDAYSEELAAQQEAAQNADFDPFAPLSELDYTQNDADASGYSDAEKALQLEVNALLLTAEKQGVDTEEIKEQAYDNTREGTVQDYLNAARAALQAAIKGGNGDSSANAGQPGTAAGEEVKPEPATQTPADAGVSVSAPAFESTARADGTLAVKGDAKAIRETLKDIPAKSLMAMKGGILVGRTQADKAAAILRGETPKITAREAAEAGQAAREADKKAKASAARAKPAAEGLSLGNTPGNAEPITVKDGLIYVGRYPAADYETGEDVKAPADATPQQIVDALKAAGAIANRQRVFGLPKADAAVSEGLTAPTKADILDQQQRKADAEKAEAKTKADADKKAKAEREAADIKKAGATAADRFVLGGNANDELSGQGGMFDAPAPAAKIDDFGEKLEGARKDALRTLNTELTDEVLATEPLSKVWPADEYLNYDDKFVSAVAFAARAEVPAKPRVDYKIKRWVQNVKIVRNLAQRVAEGKTTPAQMREALKATRGLDGFAAKVALLEAIDREQWSRIGKVGEYPNAYRYRPDGGKDATPLVSVQVDDKEHRFDASNVADVIDQVNGLLGNEVQEKKMAFEVRGSGESYSINKKGDKEYRKLKTFPTAKEALAYRSSNYNDLVAAWEGVKERDNVKERDVRSTENRPRTAADYRNGKDVTAEQFQETFGFRGGQFGNWVSDGAGSKDRQGMLNQAFDAFMDLSDILKIPPKAISLNGTLGISFGARGSGWASAHFEPGNLVINLTKTRGAGALAHEWFHAMDNYFARERGGEVAIKPGMNAQQAYRESNFITYRPEPLYVYTNGYANGTTKMTKATLEKERAKNPDSAFYKADRWTLDTTHPKGVRPEVERAFAELVDALNASPMAARARSIDKTADAYWSQIIERGARSFENYILSKMAEKGYSNDYLANVKPVQDFPRSKERYPYLMPEEVAPVAEAFDNLFSTIDTKETDKGVAMFAKGFDPEAFSRMYSTPTAMAVTDVQKAVDELSAKWKSGPTIKVVATPDDLPVNAPADARGLIQGNTAYIVASRQLNRDDVARTLGHEAIGHYGLWAILDEQSKAQGKDLRKEFERNLQLALKSGNVPLNKLRDKVRAAYVDGKGNFNLSPANESNEIAAFAVEAAIDPATGEFKPGYGFLKKVWADLAAWLRSKGIDIKFTNIELQGMLVSAMRGLEAGQRLDGGGQVLVAAARTELPTRLGNDGQSGLLQRFRELKGPADPETAAQDAASILGWRPAVRVAQVVDQNFDQSPMWFNTARRVVEYNTDIPHFRASDAQYMVEEFIHAVDSTGAKMAITAGSPRFLEGGDLRLEIEKAFTRSQIFKQMLTYPLAFDFADGRKAVELFARVGVIFHAFPDALQITPKTLEAYRAIFQPAISGQVRTGASGDVAGDGRGIQPGGAGGRTGQGSQERQADKGLAGLARRIAAVTQADPRGTAIDGSESLQSRDGKRVDQADQWAAQGQPDLFPGEFSTKRTTVKDEIVVSSKGTKETVKRGNTNSNGRQITGTVQGLRNFWNWFRESQAADDKGRPLVMYHSTNGDFNTFETGRDTVSSTTFGDVSTQRHGIFMSPDVKFSQEYLRKGEGQNVMQLYAAISNPIDLREGINGSDLNAIVEASNGKLRRGDFSYVDPYETWTFFDDEFGRNFVDAAKSAGYDGAMLSEAGPNNNKPATTYVAFDSTQVKSVTGNKGTYESTNPNIAFARGAQTNLFQPNVWQTPDPSRIDTLIYNAQDGKVDLKRVQEAITKSGQQIEEKWDARLAETLYPGRVAYRSKTFLDAEVKPLLEAMARNKVDMDELADYLHARGAEERNIQIAKVNPSMPDGGAGTNTKGELMTNANARGYLAAISPARKVVLDAMAKRVDAITAETRNLLVTEGLEKQDTIDAWTAVYKNYVPMFRDEAEQGGFPAHPQGSGFTVKGSASKRATGSTKEVTNILAHVLMQREAAITRAEKNRVALALYGQALSHPNPDFWTTIKPSMAAAAIGAELQAMGVDPMTAQVGMQGVPTVTTISPLTGKVVNSPNPMYKNLPGAIPLKVNGEDRVLMLNVKQPRGQRLAESLKNLDGLTQFDLANTIVGKSTRFLAAVNTQYNPAFGLVNLTRDVLEGAINIGSTELRGNATMVLAQTPLALQGIGRELAADGKGGTWGALYKQFVADGGQTGFKENFRDPNDRARAVEKELKRMESAGKLTPGNAAHAALDLLDGFNTTLENGVRLSAYKVALDKGISRQKAARLARELTVDFNRKGRIGREVGPLYAFFNASVQGAERALRTLRGPTGRKIIAGGLALGVLQAMMLAAAGYDDDEVPEFVKTTALVIPTNWTGKGDKTHILIPMPLGFRMVPNTGRVLTELTLNGGKNISKRIVDAIGIIAGSFNPLGGGNVFTMDGALKTVAPTLIDPLIELGFNKNFAGGKIEKESYGGETDGRPGIARTKEATQRSTTGQVYMAISKAINTLAGGNDYQAGVISPTPERVRYLAQTVGGGVLREIEKTVNASTATGRGEKVKSSQIPVLGRFYGEVDDDQVQTSRYFEQSKKLKTLQSQIKAAEGSGDGQAMVRMLTEHPELAFAKAQEKTQASISKLNKLAVSTVKDPEAMKMIDEARVAQMKALNQAMEELEKASGKVTLGDRIKPKRSEAVADGRGN